MTDQGIPQTYRLMIADDHQLFRKGVITALGKLRIIESISEASNGNEVLELLRTTPVDLILMDISMPDMDGIEATKLVKRKYPSIKIIALGMHDNARMIMDMYQAGVNGYILKNTDRAELEKAIHTVMNGKFYNSADVSTKLIPGLLDKNFGQQNMHEKEKLSDRECEVLALICKEFTSQEIADKLVLSTRTVESHRINILRKTNSKNMVGLLKYALAHGIVNAE